MALNAAGEKWRLKLGFVVSTIVFLLALTWFLLKWASPKKRAQSGSAEEASDTIIDEGGAPFALIPDLVHENDDIGAVSAIIVATLEMQKSDKSAPAGSCPGTARDNYSIGYIGGYVDAVLRRKRIVTMRTGYTIGELVFVGIFGSNDGFTLYEKYLSLQHASDAEFFAGMAAGDTDIERWFKNNLNAPLGWNAHVHDTPGVA